MYGRQMDTVINIFTEKSKEILKVLRVRELHVEDFDFLQAGIC